MTRYEEEGRGGTDLSDARTLVSTPNALEVGITGGAHGWLRVRAELEHTGEVTASLVASSAASAEALHQELSSMSAYLKNEVVGVSSLTVSAPESSGAMHGFGSQATPGGMTSGAGGDGAAHGGAASEGSRGDGKQSSLPGISSLVNGLAPGYASVGVPAALLGSGVGGWLNVRV